MIKIYATIVLSTKKDENGNIVPDETIEIWKNNLLYFDGGRRSKSQVGQPAYGIISNSCTISFVDYEGKVLKMQAEGKLKRSFPFSAKIVNTLIGKEENIVDFQTTKWEYDESTKTVSVYASDGLEELQTISANGELIDYNGGNTNLSYVYNRIAQQTPTKFKLLPFSSLDIETQTIIYNTYKSTEDYAFYDGGTLWNLLQSLCEVCGLYIFKERDKTVCRYFLGG